MRRLALLLLAVAGPAFAAESVERAPAPRPVIDLTGYRTAKTARRADPKTFRVANSSATAGFVGVEIGAGKNGRPVIEEIAPDSPAEKAGLRAGDVVTAIGGVPVASQSVARDRLRAAYADEALVFTVERQGMPYAIRVVPRPASRPLGAANLTAGRAILGIQADSKSDGAEVTSVTEGGGAARAGLKVGDRIVKIGDTKLSADTTLREVLSRKRPGDSVIVSLRRDEKELELRVTLQGETTRSGGRAGGWDDRLPRAWTKPGYRLAILGVEYPDVKHNAKITDAAWNESLFSLGPYTGKSATGQSVHGSMNDYYREISYGKFRVSGKFLGWVEVSKKRTEYSTGSGTSVREKTALLTEAMDKYLAKHGKDALRDYDGVFFLYAGGRVRTTRGGLYWPHRATVTHRGKRWPYFIVQEGGDRMTDISVFCHEFGHMLGLPDLYARPEVPGMEGVGVWCAMSQQNGGGRPQHFSAWSKEQLGWLRPVPIDPRIKQKIVLAPVEDSPEECLKVLVKPDGSEYFLLENRRRRGFDAALPAEGLLIWRVTPDNRTQKVFLEESHGVAGPTGPRLFPASVPFPSRANDSFTPYTTPSSKSQLGGGLDVYITNIRRLPDGRVTFHIGYEFQ
jgi:M6 family metalloprotease-like protein